MQIYIKGPDGKPLIPKSRESEDKKDEINEYIRDILECAAELIPSDWSKTALYAEVLENGVSFQLVYTSEGSKRGRAKAEQRNLVGGKMYEIRKENLVDAVKRLYEKYLEHGKKWEALSIVFKISGEYTAEFFEKVDTELSPEERIEQWKLRKLKVRQKEESEKKNISAMSIEIHRKDNDK